MAVLGFAWDRGGTWHPAIPAREYLVMPIDGSLVGLLDTVLTAELMHLRRL
jgi:hypothetical protein